MSIRSVLRMIGLSGDAANISTRIARSGDDYVITSRSGCSLDRGGLATKDNLARLKRRPAMKDM